MAEKIKIVLCGAAGRMGQAVKAEIAEGKYDAVISGEADLKWNRPISALSCPGDAALDFSSAGAAKDTLSVCIKRQWAAVLAATGEMPMEEIEQASIKIPVLLCPNFSKGAGVQREIAKKAAQMLGAEYDCVVEEIHHKHKKHAPGGTAKMLLEAMGLKNDQAVSVRAGEVNGIHRVSFFGEKDMLEITHTVFDRRLFAASAIRAAMKLSRMAPGLYGMDDLTSF